MSNYDLSKSGRTFLQQWSMWVPDGWLTDFIAKHGRPPATKAEIDAFKWDGTEWQNKHRNASIIEKAAADIAANMPPKAVKPVLKFPEKKPSMPPIPGKSNKGFTQHGGGKTPGFQVPKRYT